MTLLSVVERELRVAARRRGAYWSRLTAAAAGWAVATWKWFRRVVAEGVGPKFRGEAEAGGTPALEGAE